MIPRVCRCRDAERGPAGPRRRGSDESSFRRFRLLSRSRRSCPRTSCPHRKARSATPACQRRRSMATAVASGEDPVASTERASRSQSSAAHPVCRLAPTGSPACRREDARGYSRRYFRRGIAKSRDALGTAAGIFMDRGEAELAGKRGVRRTGSRPEACGETSRRTKHATGWALGRKGSGPRLCVSTRQPRAR